MNNLKQLLCLNIFIFLSVSATVVSASSSSITLHAGDILLQPLHCWSCNLIEAQTTSQYSHVGIVLENNKSTKEVTVGEAFIKVRAVSLSEYLSKTEKRKKVKVMRPKKTSNRFHILKKYFISQLEGLPYDREFRLNNSINGIEAIYCSELVYKLLTWTGNTTPDLSIMLFDVNRDYWEKYFRGNVPDGEYGISPSDFDDENLYEFVGYL